MILNLKYQGIGTLGPEFVKWFGFFAFGHLLILAYVLCCFCQFKFGVMSLFPSSCRLGLWALASPHSCGCWVRPKLLHSVGRSVLCCVQVETGVHFNLQQQAPDLQGLCVQLIQARPSPTVGPSGSCLHRSSASWKFPCFQLCWPFQQHRQTRTQTSMFPSKQRSQLLLPKKSVSMKPLKCTEIHFAHADVNF